jgi:dGTPase
MINAVVSDLIETSKGLIASVDPKNIDDVRTCGKSLISLSKETETIHKNLKKFLMDNLYRHEKVDSMAEKAKETVEYLFNAYMKDLKLLTPELQTKLECSKEDNDENAKARLIADYIAGMTDRFAFSELERISSN